MDSQKNEKKFYELTTPQKSIWYTENFYKNTPICNISGTTRIDEVVNFKLLEEAVKLTVKNNDSLRIKITLKDYEPVQYFEEYEDFDVKYVELNNEEEYTELINDNVSKPFEILDNYLTRFTIFKFPNGTGGCNIVHHHIISDAWSSTLASSELISNYEKLKKGIEFVKKDTSYQRFISDEQEYKKSEKGEKDKKYWIEKYNVIDELATFDVDSVSPKYSAKAERKEYRLSKSLVKSIKEYCQANSISLFVFFISIYSIYLSRVTQLDKVTLGTPVLNRKDAVLKQTMGMFVNTVPFDVNVEEGDTFSKIIRKNSLESFGIFKRQRYAYIELLQALREKDKTINSLYDVIFSYQNAHVTESGVKHTSKWDFTGYISETIDIHVSDIDDTNELNIYYDYQIEKLSVDDIEDIHERIIYIIDQILSKDCLIKDLEIVTPKERKVLLNEYDMDVTYPDKKTVIQLFEEQVQLTPDRIAVTIGDETISYHTLNEKASQFSKILIKNGVGPEVPVALRMTKSINMIVAIIAIMKAGGCYLPIDLSYPIERIKFMISDSGAKLLVSNTKVLSDFDFENELEVPILNLDIIDYSLESKENVKVNLKPDNLIYIIYTSGSTGVPKGVMITHRNVVRLMKNDNYLFDFNEHDTWVMFHSVAFDFSVWEMYGALLYGGKLVLVPENVAKDVNKFLELLRKERVTVLNQTPTYFYNLLEREMKQEDSSLKIRYIIFGGEALKPNLIHTWKDKYPFTKLINMYGITETTVHVTFKELTNTDLLSPRVNIGVPIPTLNVYVMDKNLKLMPMGIKGEMCVAGSGICRGYLNRPELNEKRFVENPYKKGEKLYRSGDNAIRNKNGNLYYKDRIDNQVKVRGFRIELGEIETKLLKHPAIQKCVVIPKKNSDKDCSLVAYVMCQGSVKIKELKDYMKTVVPIYMVPNYFVKLDSMPINSNGKVDRKKLQTLEYTFDKSSAYIKARNKFEETLQGILERELKIKQISIDDDILDLGADSLTLMKVAAEMLENNYEISIQKFYENRNIRAISDSLKNETKPIRKLKENIYFDFKDEYVNKKFDVKNILLTGATGFLGAHILRDLIQNTEANIYCIVRNSGSTEGKKRLKETLEFYFNDEISEYIDNRIIMVTGDVSKPNMGIDKELYIYIGNRVDLVIHSAAIVKHYGEEEIFEKINVMGTQNVIDFCKTFDVRLNHISTTSILTPFAAGQEHEELNEHTLYVGQAYEENVYIKTKFRAEYYVWKAMKAGVKACIFRMGNISSRVSDGKFQINNTENAFVNRLRALAKVGVLPKELAYSKVEFSPVDVCSLSIVELMQYEDSYNRIYHIENDNKVLLKDAIYMISGKEVKLVEISEFMEKVKNSKDSLGLINDITNNIMQMAEVNVDSDLTVKRLNSINMAWPRINEEYLKRIQK